MPIMSNLIRMVLISVVQEKVDTWCCNYFVNFLFYYYSNLVPFVSVIVIQADHTQEIYN